MGRKVLASLVVPLALWAAQTAAAASAGAVVVAHAKVRDQALLLHLVQRARPTSIPEPTLRTSHPGLVTSRSPRLAPDGTTSPMSPSSTSWPTPHAPLASLAYLGPQSPFPILAVGYLPSRDYDQAVGRLYSLLPNGQSVGECTATVVAVNVVLTAAHCVFDLGSNHVDQGFVFAPGMKGATEPLGTWTGNSAEYWSRFASAPETSLDYAFVTLQPNHNGQAVGNVTGYHHILEYARPHRILTEGYPASGPFAGRCTFGSCYVTYCYSPLGAFHSDDFGWEIGMGCITGHGASGGPWFVRFGGQSVVASVTSTGVRRRHRHYFRNIWGPQFDSRLDKLLRAAQRGLTAGSTPTYRSRRPR